MNTAAYDTAHWCEALTVGDKVIVKSTGYYDTPHITTITRTTRTQVFLRYGPQNREWAFSRHSGYQVARYAGLPLRLIECTEEAEREAAHRQRITAINNAKIDIARKMRDILTPEQVQELYECLVRIGLIEGVV